MTRIIPLESGTVFHVPYEECDPWLIVTKDLTIPLDPDSHELNDAGGPRSIEDHRHAWSFVHLAEDCRGESEDYGDWLFEDEA
jgi:hypothetical protein